MVDENGLVTTSTNTVTLSQLTPDTTYRFRVSAITQDGEQGAEVLISGSTTEATRGTQGAFDNSYILSLATPAVVAYTGMKVTSDITVLWLT